jgi:hypothetical protein
LAGSNKADVNSHTPAALQTEKQDGRREQHHDGQDPEK